ncbi:hypothetical protein GCM10009787_78500 [Streptomyces bangladeshensis]|uniref:Uncharacterized protein n=1 Tax=Streptomyces bangladeshensis TaxID=295352 RepID=A0ABN1ZKY0_9ACTN
MGPPTKTSSPLRTPFAGTGASILGSDASTMMFSAMCVLLFREGKALRAGLVAARAARGRAGPGVRVRGYDGARRGRGQAARGPRSWPAVGDVPGPRPGRTARTRR